jgi:hypothetical protein
MRIFGPTSDEHRYYLLSILSILSFSIATNFAAGVQGKGRGNSGSQLSINSPRRSSGHGAVGTSVTVSGTGFVPSASVAFGGVVANLFQLNPIAGGHTTARRRTGCCHHRQRLSGWNGRRVWQFTSP